MAQLTPSDAAILAPALGDDAETVAAEIEAGASRLVRYDDGSRIVLRLEPRPERPELVIVGGAGEDAPGKVAAIVEHAERQGWSVRFHTRRPALGRLLARLGFTEIERVYAHGR
ncbi:hypothetical protein [Halomonas sp. NO4]|uniref:hypothetical protein n=1 Tax=Halomonas sp. NO4 TaxID=2484813 RepID=UPI0013D3ED3D|nr:hypothetical protein [Halomonas sp. NO4]